MSPVIVNPGSTRLRARTVAVEDPGRLTDYMTERDCACFLHHGDGVVGIGEIARFETDSPAAADVWWEAFCAEVENETEMPGVYGTGPLAFGSFAFDPDRSASQSVMVVPRTVIGRRYGTSWLTQLSYDRVDTAPPRPQPPARVPSGVRLGDGTVDSRRWLEISAHAREFMSRDGLESLLLMRDLLARADEEVDPRWIVGRLTARFPGAWTYLVEGAVGSTSKLTVQVKDSLVTSRALSHLPPRRQGDVEGLLDTLTGSGPAARAHAATVAWTRETLMPFCRAVHHPEAPGIVVSPDASYLVTDLAGVAGEHTTSLGLVDALHPTPFVSGTPPWQAAAALAEIEELDRGRVSGPVGWIDSLGNGQWVTDSRGAQIDRTDPRQVHMFAGIPVSPTESCDDAADLDLRMAVLRALALD